MPNFLKYIYLLIFLFAGLAFGHYVYRNSDSWKVLYKEIKKSETVKVSPTPPIRTDGTLFTKGSPSLSNRLDLPCVENEADALELLTGELAKNYKSPNYYESNVKPLLENITIDTDDYFYRINIPSGIDNLRYAGTQDIFRCSFFKPTISRYINVDNQIANMSLGTINADKTEYNLNLLVGLLYKFQLVDLDLFGKKITLTNTVISNSDRDITRTDTGSYSPSNNIFTDDTQNRNVKIEFILDKTTGEVILKKTIE